MREPTTKVRRGDMALGGVTSSSKSKSSFITLFPSPMMIIGARTNMLRRLVYHERRIVLPLTTLRLCLMTTECVAVIVELATPNTTPLREIVVPSRKTPQKKPTVTMTQEKRMRKDGRVCRTTPETPTVNGRTSPRAT
jgi:hypothetical protein